jgi:hypothetical protein
MLQRATTVKLSGGTMPLKELFPLFYQITNTTELFCENNRSSDLCSVPISGKMVVYIRQQSEKKITFKQSK